MLETLPGQRRWLGATGAWKPFAVGWRDREANLPVERDTMFRLASMSKPVTSLAALMLVEQGRMALTDPISRYAPEFSELRVMRSPGGPLDDTVAAERQITFEDLLTHRAGLNICRPSTRPDQRGIPRGTWRRN